MERLSVAVARPNGEPHPGVPVSVALTERSRLRTGQEVLTAPVIRHTDATGTARFDIHPSAEFFNNPQYVARIDRGKPERFYMPAAPANLAALTPPPATGTTPAVPANIKAYAALSGRLIIGADLTADTITERELAPAVVAQLGGGQGGGHPADRVVQTATAYDRAAAGSGQRGVWITLPTTWADWRTLLVVAASSAADVFTLQSPTAYMAIVPTGHIQQIDHSESPDAGTISLSFHPNTAASIYRFRLERIGTGTSPRVLYAALTN